MLKIDGVDVPVELEIKLGEEIEDATERNARVMEFVRAQGGVALPKAEAERDLDAPLMALRDKLVKRAKDAKEAREARAARNAELSARNAPARGARGTAPAAKPATTTTQDVVAPKPVAKAQG